jgi:hypothetical protein
MRMQALVNRTLGRTVKVLQRQFAIAVKFGRAGVNGEEQNGGTSKNGNERVSAVAYTIAPFWHLCSFK